MSSEYENDPIYTDAVENIKDLNYDENDSVKLEQVDAKDYDALITTYPWNSPDGIKKVPIPVRWHPTPVVKNIINHNKNSGGYTGVVQIGMSGAGKTTITKMIVHKIHELGEHYIVRWYTGHDLLNVDKIINSCVVGVPHILIFDDASYTLQNAKKEQVARLANALTTIRHKIKSRIITIMNIHYSKAMLKFFRNQHFTILVSVTPEEMGNYAELFKEYMGHIKDFAKIYRNMLLRGFFRIPVDSFTGEYITYATNKPFRVALVAEITDLHPMVYARERCDECDPLMADKKLKSTTKTMEELFAKYGDGEVRTTASFFATIHGGKNWLPRRHKSIWMHLTELARNGIIDYEEMMRVVEESRQRDEDGRPKETRRIRKQSVKDLLEDIKEEELNPEQYKARKDAEKQKALDEAKLAKIKAALHSPEFDKNQEDENFEDNQEKPQPYGVEASPVGEGGSVDIATYNEEDDKPEKDGL